jgi:hypothetical protein
MGKRAPELATGDGTQTIRHYYAESGREVIARAAQQREGELAYLDLDAITRD